MLTKINKDRLIVLDLYGRVGKCDERSEILAVRKNLLIMNTFFKMIKSRNEKSVVDYVILDARARRIPEIGSDHYVVEVKISLGKSTSNRQNLRKISDKPKRDYIWQNPYRTKSLIFKKG